MIFNQSLKKTVVTESIPVLTLWSIAFDVFHPYSCKYVYFLVLILNFVHSLYRIKPNLPSGEKRILQGVIEIKAKLSSFISFIFFIFHNFECNQILKSSGLITVNCRHFRFRIKTFCFQL